MDKPILAKGFDDIKKTRYWTPDGREKFEVPALRGYTKNGIEGVRDANYDKGWLPEKPTKLKPYCPHCDNWHDTKLEVDECGKKKQAFQNKMNKEAKKLYSKESEVDTLKKDVSELKDMFTALMEKLNGKIL